MAENVIVVQFPESSKCYEFFSFLRNANASGSLKLHEAVVIEHEQSGQYQVKDGHVHMGDAVSTGTLLGALVGLLGGPLGMLFGASVGTLLGASSEVDRAVYAQSVVAQVSQSVPRGSTAVIATLDEPSEDVVNAEVNRLGGAVLRWSAEDVQNEIAAQVAAQAAADREASRVLSEQHKAERQQKIAEWKDHAKADLDKVKSFLNRDIL